MPQKGATPEMLTVLDHNLSIMAEVIREIWGSTCLQLPGSGAAGGVGAALYAFCQAKLQPGIHLLLDFYQFEEVVQEVDLVITGEGKDGPIKPDLEKRSPGLLNGAKRFRKPVVCISGALEYPLDELYSLGMDAFFSCYQNRSVRPKQSPMRIPTSSILPKM